VKTALIMGLTAVLLSGCGTVCNLAGGIVHPDSEPRVYGGVQRDVAIIEEAVKAPPLTSQSTEDPKVVLWLLSIAAVDPILSFVADTLTLPITIPLQKSRLGRTEVDGSAQSGGGLGRKTLTGLTAPNS